MAQPGKNDQRRKAQGRVFALTPQDVQVSDTVVTGVLPLFSNFAKTLFDSRSTHFFISSRYAKLCDKKSGSDTICNDSRKSASHICAIPQKN